MVMEWFMEILQSAVMAALLMAALIFLLRNLILERLGRAIAHEYDAKLEALRLQHNQALEILREARAEREAFRSLTFSTLTSIHSATLERRIKAIEVLWQSIQEIRHTTPPYIYIADMIGYDKAKFGPNLHSYFKNAKLIEVLAPGLKMTEQVLKSRPFLGDRLFALFQATQAVIGRATSTTISSYQKNAIRLWYEEPETLELLSTVLSTDELHIFQSRNQLKLDWLIRQLEAKIIQEIQDELSGKIAAEESLTRARLILEAASKAKPETQQLTSQ